MDTVNLTDTIESRRERAQVALAFDIYYNDGAMDDTEDCFQAELNLDPDMPDYM